MSLNHHQRPIVLYAEVRRFPSIKEAAAFLEVNTSAVQCGNRCKGFLVHHEEMPVNGFPIRKAKEFPVVRDDGARFGSRMHVVRSLFPEATAAQHRAAFMRITRKMRRSQTFEGHSYRFVGDPT